MIEKPFIKIGSRLVDEVSRLFYQALSEGFVGSVAIVGRVLDTFNTKSIGGEEKIQENNEVVKEGNNQVVTAAIVYEACVYMLKTYTRTFPQSEDIAGRVTTTVLNVMKLRPNLPIIFRGKSKPYSYIPYKYEDINNASSPGYHDLYSTVLRRLQSLYKLYQKSLNKNKHNN